MSASTQALLTTRESRTGKTGNALAQAKKPKLSPPKSSSIDQISLLQRTVGNREVERLLKSGVSQSKLKVNEPGDIYEQEADRFSHQVLTAPTHAPVGGTAPRIQRVAGQPAGETATAPVSVDRALDGAGTPLESGLRQEMEQSFGHDFSRVRVHTGPMAEQSARDVNARAYTVGHSLVFGAGEFNPGTREGRRLLAHELTHVAQESGAAANVVRRQGDFDDEEPTLREGSSSRGQPRGHVERRGGEKHPGNIASGEIDTDKPRGPTSGGGGSGTSGGGGGAGSKLDKPAGGAPKVTSAGGTPKVTTTGGAPKVKVPPINLSDYPPDRGGPVTRFFKDRPVLQKAGLVGGSAAAGAVTSGMMTLVEGHFEGVLKDAQKEFHATFPDIASLKQGARIDEHRAAYEEAVRKLHAPSNMAVAARAGTVFVKEKDREAYLRHVEKRLSQVKLSKGDWGGYRDAGEAYENAMADLKEQLAKYQYGLPEIADNVRRRAEVLRRAGDKLMDTFWSTIQFTVYFPIAYYQTFDIYVIARVFQNLGDQVGAFAGQIRSRISEYERLDAWLDAELINVGEQLNAPSPKRIPRK
jgi:uncharacterized protein YukE